MSINLNTLFVIFGLILLAFFGVIIAKLFERNPQEAEVLPNWVAIPIVLLIYYTYIMNFSFITYVVSIGAIFVLFL